MTITEVATKGGNATFKKHGVKFYKKMAMASLKSRGLVKNKK